MGKLFLFKVSDQNQEPSKYMITKADGKLIEIYLAEQIFVDQFNVLIMCVRLYC